MLALAGCSTVLHISTMAMICRKKNDLKPFRMSRFFQKYKYVRLRSSFNATIDKTLFFVSVGFSLSAGFKVHTSCLSFWVKTSEHKIWEI